MTAPPKGPPVRSYRTCFPADENPISEGGIWLNGRRDGIDWADVLTSHGEVYGAVTRMAVAERRVYAEIVRWNGKIGDFTSLAKLSGPQYGVQDGDVVAASIVGNLIKGYINGVEMISAPDDVFDQGCPGVGFNFFVGNTNVDHGFKYFEVDTYD